MFNSSDELKNLNLPFFKQRAREKCLSANGDFTLSTSFILVRASISRSYLPYFRSWYKTFKLNNHLLTFFSIITSILLPFWWMRLKLLLSTSIFKVFRMYCFTIFAQVSLDSFCLAWNPLSLKPVRSRGKLKEPFYRKKSTRFSIDYRGPHFWNELAHDNFRTPDSLSLFRKKIKEFILMFHDPEKYF